MMALGRMLAAVVVSVAVSSCGSGVPTTTVSRSMVHGTVTAGPTCPVERIGQPCPPRPVAGRVEARDSSDAAVVSTVVEPDGSYRMALPAGSYRLVIVTGSMLPRCPEKDVTVAQGGDLTVDFDCDTGIR